MAFTSFTASGGGHSLGTSFPDVTMFDPSSFYNWEQDNIPIQQLKDRTDVLMQMAGAPASAMNGVTLVLSSTSNPAANTYSNLSDIVSRIPKRLTYPLLVEICNYGALGPLDLRDVVTEGDGVLEIVNRNSATWMTGATPTIQALASVVSTNASSVAHAKALTLTTAEQNLVRNAASVRTGDSSYDNTQWNSYETRGFFAADTHSVAIPSAFTSYVVSGLDFATNDRVTGADVYSQHEDATVDEDTTAVIGQGTYALYMKGSTNAGSQQAAGAVYGSFFTSVSVTNCHGKIKLNGLMVDGGTGDDTAATCVHATDIGFKLTDSEVLIKNCGAARTKYAGFDLDNSKVSVEGGIQAYRIYDKNATATRTPADTAASGVGIDCRNSTLYFDDTTAGQGRFPRLTNNCDIGVRLKNSAMLGGKQRRNSSSVVNCSTTADVDTTLIKSMCNRVGYELHNSELSFAGRLQSHFNETGVRASNSSLKLTQFNVSYNEAYGFHLINSNLVYGWNTSLLSGAKAGACTLESNNGFLYACSMNGVNLLVEKSSSVSPDGDKNLHFLHGRWSGVTESYTTNHGGSRHATTYSRPGLIVRNNSYAEMVNYKHASDINAPHPGTLVQDNSKISFRGVGSAATNGAWTSLTLGKAQGSNTIDWNVAQLANSWRSPGVLAENNSIVEFTGPAKISRFGIGALAQDSSKILINAPTNSDGQIDGHRWGLSGANGVGNQTRLDVYSTRACLVANNNSTIKLKNLGGFPASSMGETDSTLNGSYAIKLPTSSVDYWGRNDYEARYLCTSGSKINFYPLGFSLGAIPELKNMEGVADYTSNKGELISLDAFSSLSKGGMCVRAIGGSQVDMNGVNFGFNHAPREVSGVFYDLSGRQTHAAHAYNPETAFTGTGTASVMNSPQHNIDNSKSNVNSTDAAGGGSNYSLNDGSTWHPLSSVSGIAATADSIADETFASMATLPWAGQLFMFNLADTSRIHASNLMINEQDPSGVCEASGWHGPPGKWTNGAALDFFGHHGQATTFGGQKRHDGTVRHFENYGPFRLLLGTRGDLKAFYNASADNGNEEVYVLGEASGGSPIDQINSQGYQTWSPMAGILSGVHGSADSARQVLGSHASEGSFGIGPSTSGFETIHGYGWAASAVNMPAGLQGSQVRQTNLVGGAAQSVSSINPQSMPPLHGDWQGYLRNWLDESAINVFANAKQLSLKKVNGISVYRSTTEWYRGGEGRDDPGSGDALGFGVGVRSLNVFDLDRLL